APAARSVHRAACAARGRARRCARDRVSCPREPAPARRSARRSSAASDVGRCRFSALTLARCAVCRCYAGHPGPRDATPMDRNQAETEGPRERLRSRGADALSAAELIALLLRTGARGRDAVDVARALLANSGGLDRLESAPAC